MHCVFHGIRFKVNKDWVSGIDTLLFYIPFPSDLRIHFPTKLTQEPEDSRLKSIIQLLATGKRNTKGGMHDSLYPAIHTCHPQYHKEAFRKIPCLYRPLSGMFYPHLSATPIIPKSSPTLEVSLNRKCLHTAIHICREEDEPYSSQHQTTRNVHKARR